WPQWLLMNGILIALFAIVDRRLARDERPEALRASSEERLRLDGWRLNGPLLILVALAVIARKFLPFPSVEVVLAACIVLSVRFTPGALREANEFSWSPMAEVGVLFAGIFVTMVPTLALLDEHGEKLGITHPWQFFWVTGLLSTVLDNAPTYLTIAWL